MVKKLPPRLPKGANDGTQHIWGFLMHLNGRIDNLSTGILVIAALVVGIGAVIIGLQITALE